MARRCGVATRRTIRLCVAAVAVLAMSMSLAAPSGAYPRPGESRIVSVSSEGTMGNGDSRWPSVGATSRFTAFQSGASNLVPDDSNDAEDIFVHDTKKRTTTLVSVASDGTQAQAHSQVPAITPNGRYVAFVSRAPNLVPGKTNVCVPGTLLRPPVMCSDVFVHDRKAGETERVSVSSEGAQGDRDSPDHHFPPGLSDNGRYVVFQSRATNLVPDDTNDAPDIFVHDRKTGETERVSVASDGAQANGRSVRPVISADGRYVAFHSFANNLVPGLVKPSDQPGVSTSDIFVHDRRTGETELVSVSYDGTQTGGAVVAPWNSGATISADGRFVAFQSTATSLVPNHKSPFDVGIYVRDRKTERTERVSVTSAGEIDFSPRRNDWAEHPAISADGRYVTFVSWGWLDERKSYPGHPESLLGAVHVHDRKTGATDAVDTYEPRGTQRTRPDISPDGRYVAFMSPGSFRATEPIQIHLRDKGLPLGVGGVGGRSPGGPEPDPDPDPIICIEGICLPPPGSVSFTEGLHEVDSATSARGGELYGGSIAYRLGDLYAVLELESMPSTPQLAAATAGLVYGMSFEVDGKAYEVRVASTGLGSHGETTADFGLFSCPQGDLLCTKVSDLRGGFGTTGERITFSVPIDELEIKDGSVISNAKAWTALGTFWSGPARLIDEASLQTGEGADAGSAR